MYLYKLDKIQLFNSIRSQIEINARKKMISMFLGKIVRKLLVIQV